MAIKFNKIADDEGLSVAVAEIGDDVQFDVPFTDAEISLTEFFDGQSYWEWVDEQGQSVDVSAPFERLYSDIEDAWPGWPDVNVDWPGWPDGLSAFPGWPDIPEPQIDISATVGVDITGSIQEFFESRVDVNPIVNEIEADLSEVNDPVDTDPFGGDDDDDGGFSDPNPPGRFGGGSDDGGGGGGGFDDPNPPGRFDTGGMVGGTGLAVVDAGERVLPPSQVTDRGEADLAQGDEITRLLRQIRRELARQDSGRDDAVVQELRQLRREVTGGDGRSRLSNRDAVDALERLADRYGADL